MLGLAEASPIWQTPVGPGFCGSPQGAISPTLVPNILAIECVEGMTFKKIMVIFHTLNHGLIYFEWLLLFIISGLKFWAVNGSQACCSVFKYYVFPDVIYCLRHILNQYVSLGQSYGKIHILPQCTSLRNITKINKKSIAVSETEVSNFKGKKRHLIFQGIKQKWRHVHVYKH